MTLSGSITLLHTFCSQSGCADGGQPYASLLQGTDGNFYGTTFTGGANDYGTIFKITSGGTLTTRVFVQLAGWHRSPRRPSSWAATEISTAPPCRRDRR